MANPVEPITNAYEYLLTQGVLGVLAVLLIAALVWTMKNLLRAKDDRINDQRQYTQVLQGVNETVMDLTVEVNKSSNETATHVRSTLSSLERTLVDLSGDMRKQTDEVSKLRDEQVRLAASFGRQQSSLGKSTLSRG